jgi:hypothetical protein
LLGVIRFAMKDGLSKVGIDGEKSVFGRSTNVNVAQLVKFLSDDQNFKITQNGDAVYIEF